MQRYTILDSARDLKTTTLLPDGTMLCEMKT
jgi:hypothetical protein